MTRISISTRTIFNLQCVEAKSRWAERVQFGRRRRRVATAAGLLLPALYVLHFSTPALATGLVPTYVGTPCAIAAEPTPGPGAPTPTPSNISRFESCAVADGDTLVACLALSSSDGGPHGVACYDNNPNGSSIWVRERDISNNDGGVRLVCFSAIKIDNPPSTLNIECIHHRIAWRAGVMLRFENIARREPTDRWQLAVGQSKFITYSSGLSKHVPARLFTNDIGIFAIATRGPAEFRPLESWDRDTRGVSASRDNRLRVDTFIWASIPDPSAAPVNNRGLGQYEDAQPSWAAGVMVFSGPPSPTPTPTTTPTSTPTETP